MSFVTLSIDYGKIKPEHLKKEKYLNLVLNKMDKPDNFGNTHSVTLSQTAEERAAKAPKVYFGNAKVYEDKKKEA